jgi:hypothetical protein
MGCCPNCKGGDIEVVDRDTGYDGEELESWVCNACHCEWDYATRINIKFQGIVEDEDEVSNESDKPL